MSRRCWVHSARVWIPVWRLWHTRKVPESVMMSSLRSASRMGSTVTSRATLSSARTWSCGPRFSPRMILLRMAVPTQKRSRSAVSSSTRWWSGRFPRASLQTRFRALSRHSWQLISLGNSSPSSSVSFYRDQISQITRIFRTCSSSPPFGLTTLVLLVTLISWITLMRRTLPSFASLKATCCMRRPTAFTTNLRSPSILRRRRNRSSCKSSPLAFLLTS
mmetsp:Transcript_18983/g.34168  ORF Transcript_18983/g.34168 Transcript_18983/m.34168 type:complete len:219 (-) Transcript_18983:2117-2773(-)